MSGIIHKKQPESLAVLSIAFIQPMRYNPQIIMLMKDGKEKKMKDYKVRDTERMFGDTSVKLQIHGFPHPNTDGDEMVYRVDIDVCGSDSVTMLFNSEGEQMDSGFQVCSLSECRSIPEEYMDFILNELEIYKADSRKKE